MCRPLGARRTISRSTDPRCAPTSRQSESGSSISASRATSSSLSLMWARMCAGSMRLRSASAGRSTPSRRAMPRNRTIVRARCRIGADPSPARPVPADARPAPRSRPIRPVRARWPAGPRTTTRGRCGTSCGWPASWASTASTPVSIRRPMSSFAGRFSRRTSR